MDLSSDKKIFDYIKIGMSREQVENILGKPKLDSGSIVYYGDPPKARSNQSPDAPYSIKIYYSSDIVNSKLYFGEQ